jgi:hypothetical protein
MAEPAPRKSQEADAAFRNYVRGTIDCSHDLATYILSRYKSRYLKFFGALNLRASLSRQKILATALVASRPYFNCSRTTNCTSAWG